MSKVKVGLVQMTCSGDKNANLAKAIEGVRKAAADGAQIVCLQELFTSLYFCDVEDYEHFKLAEPIPGPSTETLQKVAGELGVVIIASLLTADSWTIRWTSMTPTFWAVWASTG